MMFAACCPLPFTRPFGVAAAAIAFASQSFASVSFWRCNAWLSNAVHTALAELARQAYRPLAGILSRSKRRALLRDPGGVREPHLPAALMSSPTAPSGTT